MPATLVRVQSTGLVFSGGVNTIAITMPGTPVVGNGIIIAVDLAPGSITSFADNRGNAYRLDSTFTNGSATVSFYSCSAVVTTGSPFTITINLNITTNIVACAIEVSGAVNGLLMSRSASGGGSSTAPSTATTPALVNANVFAVAAVYTSAGPTSIAVQVVSPVWTQEAERISAAPGFEVDSRVLTGVLGTNQTVAWTLGVSANWAALCAMYASAADLPAPDIRTSQDAIELISLPASVETRVSQDAIELISLPTPDIRVSQDAIEILSQNIAAPVISETVQIVLLVS